MAAGTHCEPSHTETVSKLFNAIGKIHEVKESLLNAVTGVSGSGPAYIFQVIEAMSDGGVLAGLPRNIATDLAAQTVMGAAKMVLETGKHPGVLKDGVTSPGGTTIAAVRALEENGVRAAFISAVKAAADRGEELSRQ
jgi:pyrroline-5-carboxylate reductase